MYLGHPLDTRWIHIQLQSWSSETPAGTETRPLAHASHLKNGQAQSQWGRQRRSWRLQHQTQGIEQGPREHGGHVPIRIHPRVSERVRRGLGGGRLWRRARRDDRRSRRDRQASGLRRDGARGRFLERVRKGTAVPASFITLTALFVHARAQHPGGGKQPRKSPSFLSQ